MFLLPARPATGDIFADNDFNTRYLHGQYGKMHYALQTTGQAIQRSIRASGAYRPQYCRHIHIALPAVRVNGNLHHPQHIYSVFSENTSC